MSREEYYDKEVRELLPTRKGDIMFYGGVVLYFVLLFGGMIAGNPWPLLVWLAMVVMAYAIYYDWKRVETGIGKAGNIIAILIWFLFLIPSVLLTLAVLF